MDAPSYLLELFEVLRIQLVRHLRLVGCLDVVQILPVDPVEEWVGLQGQKKQPYLNT